MADRGTTRGGGFGARGGDRGRGRGRGRGRRGGKSEEKEWQPVTKLGRLVKAGKINSMEEIYLHSLPIKEYQIVDNFLPQLKDEVMKVRRDTHKSQVPQDRRARNSWAGAGRLSTIFFTNSRERAKSRGANMVIFPPIADQACPEADPCRSAYALQGRRHHW